MTRVLLEARGLRKTFAGRRSPWRPTAAVRAVDDVTLALMPGERVGLVGESGSGKSTLARLLVGLTAADGGTVQFGSHVLDPSRGWPAEVRRRMQLVFQDPTGSLNPRMTVEELISEPLIIHGLGDRDGRRARVEALLRLVQLPGSYRERLPRELSGGERQRVGIARAMATEPALLICDEPIASLDVSVGAKILELLRRLSEAHHTALLFISHDLRAVAALCERVAVMAQGRLVEAGRTEELLARPSERYTDLLVRAADLDLDSAPQAS